MQLLLEQSLAAIVAQEGILPASYRTYPAHGADVINADQQNYLRIVAGRPRDQTAGVSMFPVELQLYSGGIEDETKIPAVTAAHDALTLLLFELFALERLPEALVALNAPLVEGILFSGWEQDPSSEDGRTDTQLVGRLKYNFWACAA